MKGADKSTRDRILDASEGLFFGRGYDGVSTRDITERAGVNVAAINYHFGGKKNLYREVLRRRLAPFAEKRIAALKGAVEEGRGLRDVIRVFVSGFFSDMSSSREAMSFLNILQREISVQGAAADVLIKEVIAPVHSLLKTAIRRERPSFSEEKAALCCISITGQMFQFCRGKKIVKQVTGQSYDKKSLERIVGHITDFSVGGIKA